MYAPHYVDEHTPTYRSGEKHSNIPQNIRTYKAIIMHNKNKCKKLYISLSTDREQNERHYNDVHRSTQD